MKTHLFLILSIIAFSCQNKQGVVPLSNNTSTARASAELHSHYDYIAVRSGYWSDTSIWAYYNGGLMDAHDVPGKTNSVFIPAGVTVTLDSLQECLDINLNTTADVIRLNTGEHTLNVWGKLRIYEGSYPGGSTPVFSSGIVNWITGNISFKGDTREIIKPGEYNANNTNSGWSASIDFNQGQEAYINERVRIENVYVNSGVLRFREELRIGTNYPGGSDTTVNGMFIVKSGSGVISGSKITKNSYTKCSSVIFQPNTWLTLSRNLEIKTNAFIEPDTINANGYSLTY